MENKIKNRLVLETLEPRRLLGGFWYGVDVDGDDVEVELIGRGEFVVNTIEEGLGEAIDSIELIDTNAKSKLFIDAYQNADGDGVVDVGFINAAGLALKLINVDGYLGDLEVGALKKITVEGNLIFEDGPTLRFLDSNVKKIHVWGSLEQINIEVAGNLKKVVIEGDMAASALAVDGRLGRMQVFGDVTDDSLIYARDQIKKLSIYGNLDYSLVETDGYLKTFYAGYDIIDSEIYAGLGIGKLVTDGSIDNTLIETAGGIRVIDAWDLIIDSEIIAGPQGIRRIYAWNSSNSTIETTGPIGRIILDEYDRNERWDDLVIIEDNTWYWPVYDYAYIDYYYTGGDYYYYYDPYYWDTYYYDDYYDGYYYWDTYYDGGVYYDAGYYYGDYYYEDPYYYDPYYYDTYSYDYYYDSYYDTYYYDSYYYDDYYYADIYYYDNSDWGLGFYADFTWWW